MIEITQKEDCCGCNCCVQICPIQCISMHEDKEGFSYPQIDIQKCINCHLCEKVCPIINQPLPQKPLKVYAAINHDREIRKQSSSRGIFTLLAEQILKEGGVVFGATFNSRWEVVHGYIESREKLSLLRGSKYVQSKINNNYQIARAFLEQNKKVLFSGTPCQILGLKHFLKKEYPNLLTIDFICHGVPSPKVWKLYLLSLNKDLTFSHINMRDKSKGWRNYSFHAIWQNPQQQRFEIKEVLDDNVFRLGFLKDIYLRPACYKCAVKQLKSKSDITLGDFWKIEKFKKEMDDNNGVSLVIVNTSKGQKYSNNILIKEEIHINDLKKLSKYLVLSPPINKKRNLFFKNLENQEITSWIKYCSKDSKFSIFRNKIISFIIKLKIRDHK